MLAHPFSQNIITEMKTKIEAKKKKANIDTKTVCDFNTPFSQMERSSKQNNL
jgi:predicted nucleic acid-binding protein